MSGKLPCRKKALSFLKVPDAIVLFKHLNLPAYLLPFLGTAKLLGCLTLLLPKYPMPIGFALIAGSYIYFLKRRTQPGEVAGKAINPGLAA